MSWGVEMLDIPERIGFAVNHAGVDLISGLFDNEAGLEAYMRGKNGYYVEHPVPEGFTKEQLILTDEALDRAVARTLKCLRWDCLRIHIGIREKLWRQFIKMLSSQRNRQRR